MATNGFFQPKEHPTILKRCCMDGQAGRSDLVVDLKPSLRRLKLAEAKSLRNRCFTEKGMQGR